MKGKKIVNNCDGCEKKMSGMEISRKVVISMDGREMQSQHQTSVRNIFQRQAAYCFVAFFFFFL